MVNLIMEPTPGRTIFLFLLRVVGVSSHAPKYGYGMALAHAWRTYVQLLFWLRYIFFFIVTVHLGLMPGLLEEEKF